VTPAIRLGDTGPVVAEIRDRLVRLDLLPAAPDTDRDRFDDAVDQAVRAFQQERGITVDGAVGGQTFRRLEEARWRLGDRVLTYTPGHLTGGDDIRELQTRLTRMGFDCGRCDGIFGPLTDHALRDFQRNVGVDPDGTCGPSTFKALDRLVRTVGNGTQAATLREQLSLDQLRSGVADKVVVLDPGHGGDDPGGAGYGLVEATVADDVGARVEGRLAALGTQVLMTRPRSHELVGVLDEATRAQFANDTDADLVVSLHTDSSSGPRANGVVTFFYGDPAGGAHSVSGACAADLMQDEIAARTDLLDCHTHARTWDLLRLTRMPAVRIELGYLSHPGDASRLADPSFRDVLAEGVASAIVRFFAPE
jgi:N-acetylmuramoyl-L-alanine amidase